MYANVSNLAKWVVNRSCNFRACILDENPTKWFCSWGEKKNACNFVQTRHARALTYHRKSVESNITIMFMLTDRAWWMGADIFRKPQLIKPHACGLNATLNSRTSTEWVTSEWICCGHLLPISHCLISPCSDPLRKDTSRSVAEILPAIVTILILSFKT